VRASQALTLAGVDVQASTIHRTLGVMEAGYGGDQWGFQHNAKNPLPFRFVVVDESSMIDTSLMADLLDACGPGTHVLFVGDPYQLPPVGHGAPLRDMIDAGEAFVSRGELTQVRRNAGQIVHACARIKNGESFEVCDAVDLDALPPKNLKLMCIYRGHLLQKLR
jgi:exodeoxyribonuclease-5/exodeoxyribonuclease V alpha subunit